MLGGGSIPPDRLEARYVSSDEEDVETNMGRLEGLRRYKSEGKGNNTVSTVLDGDGYENVNGGIAWQFYKQYLSYDNEKDDGKGGDGTKCLSGK